MAAIFVESGFMSIRSQMFLMVNCSNFEGKCLTIIILHGKKISLDENGSIWPFQFWLQSPASRGQNPLLNIIRFFLVKMIMAERTKTLALGIMVKLLWLDRILYSRIEAIENTYEQYWQPSWWRSRAREGRIYRHTLCLEPGGAVSRAEIDIN